jgi:4-hydroxy 2-oxovalerate aldolase
MNLVELHDLTLRDGNHAIGHKLSKDDIIKYCKFAESQGVPVIEVGHGNGLGASTLTLGESSVSDDESIMLAREHLKNTKLSVHIIPGLATIRRDVDRAIELGVDIFRVATHCTEASLSKSHIEYLVRRHKTVFGVLMMSATCSTDVLIQEALKMKSYGSNTIIIMDSTGSYLPGDVKERVSKLVDTGLRVGFHGHNNLHLAVANSLAAIEAGASIIDVTMHGFGAGAGNTPLEIMTTLLWNKTVDATFFNYPYPISRPINIMTAKHKLFSGFDRHILDQCSTYNLDMNNFIKRLGNSHLTAGQEDLISRFAVEEVKAREILEV